MDREGIARLRIEYEAVGIDETDVDTDPVRQFHVWFGEAVAAGIEQPNAFVLATTGPDGRPSARAVLMKGFGPEGLAFYTNRSSRKGMELAANPWAAACFVWPGLHRQVRVEGEVQGVSDQESDAYFGGRPAGARLAAAASPQSRVVAGRQWLEERLDELRRRFPDGEVPRPEEWGGYRIVPDVFEMWQGRPDRFHDRIRYLRREGAWSIERLAP